MTERKPSGMSFNSWIDQQISEAAERGAFDDLPGTGKPIPNNGNEDAGQAWLRSYLRKEGVSADALLPPPLRLRKEIERLKAAVPAMRSEAEVREAAGELNHQIMQWRRIPIGPPVFVPLVDEEAIVRTWREAQATAAAGDPGTAPAAGAQAGAHAAAVSGTAAGAAAQAGRPASAVAGTAAGTGAATPARAGIDDGAPAGGSARRRWLRRRAPAGD
jgi:hypothetical protein